MKETNAEARQNPRLDDLTLDEMAELRRQSGKRKKRSRIPPLAPQERPGLVPLSYAQERLWFLDQLGLVGPAYNMPMPLRLRGELNVTALELSFSELIRRHESLRTRVDTREGSPVQIIDAPGPFVLEVLDLSQLSPSDRDLQGRLLINEDAQRPFDLTAGPVLRASLLRLEPQDHVLLLTMHHIVSDGWSLGVLNRELGTLYTAYSRGDVPPLSQLPVQYADYAIWQRQWMQGGVLQNQLQYWREQLTGAPPQLQLPTDRPRPEVASFRGALFNFRLSAVLRAALEELAQREAATLFMVLLAGYQVLLSRHSGQRDIVVGSAIAGRTHPNTEDLIGFFVNTLILRTDLSGDPSFRQLLGRVKEITLGAYAHQDLPFEKLVMELRPERSLTRQPVFQVALALQNAPQESLDLAGLTWTRIEPEQVTALFDLTLHMYEEPDGIHCQFEYATDLFDASTIELMSEQFRTVLERMVAQPDSLIDRGHGLSELERLQIMEWNNTQTAVRPEDDVTSVLQSHAHLRPETAAISDGHQLLTYGQLNARADQLAQRLLARGVGKRARVGVYMHPGTECVVSFHAVLKTGATYVPLDRSYPVERLDFICKDADVGYLLTSDGELPPFDHSRMESIRSDELDTSGAEPEFEFPVNRSFDPTSPAYIIYTSGSTGRPKGVLLHRLGLANVIAAQRRSFGLSPTARVTQLASICFDASVFEFVLALGVGACLFAPSREERRPGGGLTDYIKRNAISVATITPSALSTLPPGALPSLQTLIVAGEEFPVDLARRWSSACRVFNAYGPTETTIWATVHQCTGAIRGRLPIGRPIDNTRVHILDADLRPTAIGQAGELCIGGLGVALGYINRPDITSDRFIDDPVYFGQGRVYRTGDLARWRQDGTVEFLGRIDDQVKIRGFRIEPAEIEAVLLEHPSVKQAAVLAREDAVGERRLVSYIVGRREGLPDALAGPEPEKVRDEIVGEWETLWKETYGKHSRAGGPSFVGWNSSYTGQPIPESQMQEWLTCTVERVRALRPQKVLEIGCGVGLVLQHLAPQCTTYLGTDISTSALERLQRWVSDREDLGHVQLQRRAATQLGDIEPGTFDTMILNSVVQYFPDIDYLLSVLTEGVRLLGPGGRIFIGDVRHYGLLPMFHSAVELIKAVDTSKVGQLKKRIARAVAQEKELVIDPAFFQVLPKRLAGIGAAEVQIKRGRGPNELTRYRYDVVLHLGNQISSYAVAEPLDWKTAVGSVEQLEAALSQRQWSAVRLLSVPNDRLTREAAVQRTIERSDDNLEVRFLKAQLDALPVDDVDPELIFELGKAHGYDVELHWGPGTSPESFDVELTDRARADQGQPKAWRSQVPELPRPWSAYANNPAESSFRQQLIPQLREHLKSRLPEYMVPSAWMVLEELPLTPNGKVDRRALPAPQDRPEELGEYVAPRTELERTLASIWAKVLRVDQVGVRDNFFELGGHSLLIVQLMERLREAGLATEVRSIYASPTLADLARTMTGERVGQFEVPPNLIPADCEAITPKMLPLLELEPDQIERIIQAVPGGVKNVQDIYPLASLQEGILFHYLLNEQRGDTYVRSILLSLSSRQKLDELIQALQAVIDRHDVLRTAVLWEQLPQPVQVVYRRAELPVQELVLNPDKDPIAQLKDRMTPEQQRLELRRAPLMRLQVARDPIGSHWYALLQTHHLVCDNESREILLAEVMAYVAERTPELPEPVAYRNHVAQALAHDRAHAAESFFRRKLGDVDEPTAPFGLLDVHGDGSRIEEARQELEPLLAQRIRAQARRMSVSAATLFHAAWALVVSCTSGRHDVVYGTVLLGRLQGRAGAQRILGMFINTLPLRFQLQSVTARELVAQTHRELAELLDYEQASLAVAQRCSAIDGSVPLFSSLLNYRHSGEDLASGFDDADGVELLASQGRTNYPLVLSVDDLGDGFVLEIEADRSLDAARMIGYARCAMESLLNALEQESDTPAFALSILPDTERHQVIEVFNPQPTSYPSDKLIHELFEEQARRMPDAVAVVYEQQSITYAVLNDKANRLARYLRSKGVGPDQLVGLCLDRSLEQVIGLLAILKAGGAYVPLDPKHPTERLHYMLGDASPKVVLTQEHLKSRLPRSAAELIALDTDWKDIACHSSENLRADAFGLSPSHLAYVIYTSGSTGVPKGVMVEHRNVVNHWQALECLYRTPLNCRRIAVNAPFTFDASVQQFVQLLSGCTLFIIPHDLRLNTRGLLDYLEQHQIEGVDCTPSQLNTWVSSGFLEREVSKELTVLVGGEAIDKELWSTLAHSSNVVVYNVYGPTECTVDSTAAFLRNEPTVPQIGRPLGNSRVYILGRDMQPVPIGATGEIYIAGAGVARGYLNRHDLTAQRFIADPFSADRQARMYKSGDLGRWRKDGTIEYLGRNDQQVKIRGFRIELGEIEAQLQRHAQVKEAVVLAREDVRGEKRLVAYVIAARLAGAEAIVDVLREHLKLLLPEYMVPSAFVLLDHLPLTSNGKLDRRALPAPGLAAYGSRDYEAPQGEVEEILAAIWCDLLRVERIGRQDNFFQLGGHSLLIVQMLERLRRVGLTTEVKRAFDSPTLTDLANAVARDQAGRLDVPANLITPDCHVITPEMLPLVKLDARHIERIVREVPDGAVNVQDIYPLAPLQEGILFHHLLDQEGGDTYVLPMLFALSSREKLERFIAALQGVIDRHDILRTALFWEELPEPVQVVCRRAALPVQELTLDGDRDPVRQLRELMTPDRQKLPLRRAPLMRLQVAADPHSTQWYALLQLHHLVCDNKSLDTLLAEVTAFLTGNGTALPEPVGYRNHVAHLLAYARTHDAEAFFRTKLGGITEPTAPFGLIDVRGGGARIEEAYEVLESSLARRVRSQARKMGVSAATVFHAAWALVVSNTSARDDVVYGTVLLGRLQGGGGANRALGLFINTLPLRLSLNGTTAKGLVEQTQREIVELLNHEETSLAVAQRCSGIVGSAPLFSALLNYRHRAEEFGSGFPAETGATFLDGQSWTNYPIMLSVDDLGDGFALTSDTDRRIDASRVTGYMTEAIKSLLDALESAPQTPALALSILSDGERRHVVETINGPSIDHGHDLTVHELFEQQVRQTPDAIAVEHGEQRLTYLELNRKANQLARYLLNQGVCPDQVVGICVGRGLEMIVGLLGILKVGGAYMPMDPNYPVERLRHMLMDSDPQLILTQEELRGVLPATQAQVIALDSILKEIEGRVDENLCASAVGLSAQHLVYVIYTSGSTGAPKGTAMAHHSMVNLIEWHKSEFGIEKGKRVLQFAALSFDVAFQEIFSALCTGSTLVLLDEWIRRDARALAELLSNRTVNRLFAPPLMLQSLAEHLKVSGSSLPKSLEDVVTAGEQLRISPEILDLLSKLPQCRLHNHYGPTETHVVTALSLIGDTNEWPPLPPIGKPLSNTQIYILDSRHRLVPMGVPGEIYVGGDGVARGYLRRPEMTAQRFVADPFSPEPGARMYKTGDLGQWRTDGSLEYLGRNDDQVKIRGYRIELGEIEIQIVRSGKVKEAVVVAREDVPGDKRLVGYVTESSDQPLNIDELRAHLKTVLPQFMVPSALVILQALPLTPNGKLDRRALPSPEGDAYGQRQYDAPEGELERGLANIWEELLGLAMIGRRDNFFELGGHSLHVMKLSAKVMERFRVNLTVPAVFRCPTIQEMAKTVDSLRAGSEVVAGPSPQSGSGRKRTPLSFSQLAHFQSYGLAHQPAKRQIASATRLRGRLDIGALRMSLAEIVRRHDSLRTRIVVGDNGPIQEIYGSYEFALATVDMTGLPEQERAAEVYRQIDRLILEPINVSIGPLFDARLLKLREDEFVLIVVMDHMISDAYSMGIALREILTAYSQVVRGVAITLPEIAIQFADYAVRLRSENQTWVEAHGAYWRGRLSGCKLLKFPVDNKPAMEGAVGWGSVPIRIGPELLSELRVRCKVMRTTLVMTVFTAFVALVLRWCNVREAVFQYQTDGRVNPELANTVGYCAAILLLRVELLRDDSFVDLAARVAEEYCRAYEHIDYSFLEAEVPRPELARSTGFNWVPGAPISDSSGSVGAHDTIEVRPLAIESPLLKTYERDSEPGVLLYETDGEIVGGVCFPLNRFAVDTMERFARNFSSFITLVSRQPEQRVSEVVLI